MARYVPQLWQSVFQSSRLKRLGLGVGSSVLALGLSFGLGMTSAAQAQDACGRIQNELMNLHNGGGGGGRTAQLRQSIAQQSQELARARAAFDRYQCSFGASPQCGSIVAAINQMDSNISAMQRQLARADGGTNARRIAELERTFATQCGPGQRNPAPRQQQALNPGSLLEAIFGVRTQPVVQARRQDASARVLPEQRARRGFDRPGDIIREPQQPRFSGDTYRTMCVRTSDGFFWPISFSTTRDRFDEDRSRCAAMCPGTVVELYAYRNPGQQVEAMINTLTGMPYTEQTYAFSYRQNFNPDNRCTPSASVLEELRPSTTVAYVTTPTGPRVPQPTPRPSMASDPETRALDNGAVSFTALGVMTRPETDGEEMVRVVGPTYGYFAN